MKRKSVVNFHDVFNLGEKSVLFLEQRSQK